MNSDIGIVIQLALVLTLSLTTSSADAALPGALLKSPYPGSRIIWQQKNNYIDNVYLLLSKPQSKDNIVHVDKTEKLQGALETVVFSHRESDSEIEIHESYRQALLKEGYTIRFICPPGCYPQNGQANWDDVMAKYVPPISDGVMPITNISYLAASKDNVTVMVLAGGATSGDPPVSVVATVVSKSVNSSGVEINKDFITASDIARGLQQDGRIALYGVYFDSGKAELKPQSRPLLNEIAQF